MLDHEGGLVLRLPPLTIGEGGVSRSTSAVRRKREDIMHFGTVAVRRTVRSRTWRVGFSTLVLVVVLALAACGGRGAANGGATTAQAPQSGTTQGTSSAPANAALAGETAGDSSIDTTDTQVQSDIGSLNALQSDANTDYSSQDTDTVP